MFRDRWRTLLSVDVMVDKVVLLHIVVVPVADKAVLVDLVSSRSLTSDIRKLLSSSREFKTPFFCVFL